MRLRAGLHLLRVSGITSKGKQGPVRQVKVRVTKKAAVAASAGGGVSSNGGTAPGGTTGSRGGGGSAGGGSGGGGSRGGSGGSSGGTDAGHGGGTTAPTTRSQSVTFAVPAKPASADIEIALDTTASMRPALAAAQSEAAAIVRESQQLLPNSRFAFVEFQDVASQDSPVPYKLVQPLTASASVFQAALRTVAAPRSGVGGDNAEDYDYMFRESLDASIGWREGSRKFLVVIGDAQPHGAGTDGLAGCVDGSPYTHGLTAPQVLGELSAASRTLFMILQPGASASATLQCYQSMAALVGHGSAATSGVETLPQTIADLVASTFGSVSTVTATVASESPLAPPTWVTVTPSTIGPVNAPTTVAFDVKVTIPAHTPHGTYTFRIDATADGASIGTQTISITV